jgi:hypothetical protein
METWWKCWQRLTASSARCHTASNENSDFPETESVSADMGSITVFRPPVGTGLLDPDRQMRRQTSVTILADPSAHPCRGWSRYSDRIRHT